MLHLLKRGWERRGKKLLGPGAVAAVSNVEGVLAAVAALSEIGNVWPSDGTGARGERHGRRRRGEERERSYSVWAESQLRFKVRHCRTPKQWELAII